MKDINNLKGVRLKPYLDWGVRGGYGAEKNKVMTVRIDEDLERRIENFIDHPKNSWWNKGELIRAALALFLDTFEIQNPGSKRGRPPVHESTD